MWKPKVGDQIKLRTFEDYTRRSLHVWGWFEVEEVRSDECQCKTILCAAGVDSVSLTIPYQDIDPPLGWEQVYQVTAKDKAQAESIRSWLSDRGGVAVWASHDLGSAGRKMFTPGDKTDEKPHWSVVLVEVVTDAARLDIGYEEISSSKMPKKEGWSYDRRMQEWYRRVKSEG